jgi:glycosyltransferase involved in cell wall biosynthesis
MASRSPSVVAVVIPHYDDLHNLKRCIDCLRRQTWPSDQYEIVVADNNSPIGATAIQHMFADIRVVAAREQGAGPARNVGVEISKGSILAFIDSDCFAEPNWLAEGVKALGRFDYVGGKVVTAVADPRRVTPAEAYEAIFAFNFEKYIRKDKFSGTGNLFVPRAVFERVGGFKAGVSEDMEWCWRANALGYRLGYAEKAVVQHAARRAWCDFRRKLDRTIAERMALEREQPGWRWRWIIYALVVAASPFVHVPRVVLSTRLSGVRAKALGLIGLFASRFYRAYRMIFLLGKDMACATR